MPQPIHKCTNTVYDYATINYCIIIKSISTLMYTVWHVDKYKITFNLVIKLWTNEILYHIVVSSGLTRPGIIDARARYRAAARRLRNTDIMHLE